MRCLWSYRERKREKTSEDVTDAQPTEKLKANAIGFVDALVIGLNSTSSA